MVAASPSTDADAQRNRPVKSQYERVLADIATKRAAGPLSHYSGDAGLGRALGRSEGVHWMDPELRHAVGGFVALRLPSTRRLPPAGEEDGPYTQGMPEAGVNWASGQPVPGHHFRCLRIALGEGTLKPV